MATEAQVAANRSNAQKSTGPRTPEGKAKVAQNAVRHGLLARQVVIQGEDPAEFEFYRDEMLEDLAPAGPMETLLAERVVSLSWRLRRAERLQEAALDTLEEEKPAKPIWSNEAKGWVRPQPAPGREGLALGRKVVKDFAEGRILDRLLVYERRIEYSLYRTMAQLEKRQRLGCERGVSSSPCDVSSESGRVWNSAASESPGGISDLAVPAAGVCTNVPEAEGKACETNPICAASRSTGILPVKEDDGRDAHATEPLASSTPGAMDAEGQSCETNPICVAPAVEIPRPDTIPSFQDSSLRPEVQGQARQTKPICPNMNDRPVGYRPIFLRRG